VVSDRIWRAAFGGNPGALGRSVQVGNIEASLVGVMPEDFGFPLHHDVWMPLVLDDGLGPVVGARAFGRLSSDASIEQAQAEAAALTTRIDRPAQSRDRRLTTQVLSYRESLFDRPLSLLMRAIILQLNIFAALFLVLVAANVALLMFARAAAREREFVVRTALGASRGRIATRLFVEALALSSVATMVGLAATGPGLNWLAGQMTAMGGGTPPFWYVPQVSPVTAIYAGLLAVLAAIVAGVVPALKATGRNVTARLGQAGPGGCGLRFGGIWTAVTITQIATTVIFSAGASLMVRQAWRTASVDAPFAAADYLSMRVELDRDVVVGASFRTILREFQRRVADDPMVANVTIADGLPVLPHPALLVELEAIVTGAGQAPDDATVVSRNAVDENFFRTFRAPWWPVANLTRAIWTPARRPSWSIGILSSTSSKAGTRLESGFAGLVRGVREYRVRGRRLSASWRTLRAGGRTPHSWTSLPER
jgi:hypothetical protein